MAGVDVERARGPRRREHAPTTARGCQPLAAAARRRRARAQTPNPDATGRRRVSAVSRSYPLMNQCARHTTAGTTSHQRSTLPIHQQGHDLSAGLRVQRHAVLTRQRLGASLPDGNPLALISARSTSITKSSTSSTGQPMPAFRCTRSWRERKARPGQQRCAAGVGGTPTTPESERTRGSRTCLRA
jgi:hypothetical protein